MDKYEAELDGKADGDGHFEVTGTGPDARLKYHLDEPYNRTFDFKESLQEIVGQIRSRRSRKGDLTTLSYFRTHVWEAALTANEQQSLLSVSNLAVSAIVPDSPQEVQK